MENKETINVEAVEKDVKKEPAKKTTKKTKPRTTNNNNKKTTTTVSQKKVEKEPARKKHNTDDMIQVKSLRNGELSYVSPKTGFVYDWVCYGDYCMVQYQDLMSLIQSKSKFVYQPWFMIMDEDVYADREDIVKLYETFDKYEDINTFFAEDPRHIAEVLQDAPNGFKDLVAMSARTSIMNGTLDSVSAIRAIDEVLGLSLKELLK